MIDIHSHILPGLDDGAKSWDMSLEMCRLAIDDGITHIVATPHANETYSYSRKQVQTVAAELQNKVGDRLTFSIGCDLQLSYDNIEDAITHPHRYTIAAQQYLLVELSDYGIPPQINNGLFRLQAAGMIPVITHPERNPVLQRHPQRILEWVQAGCLVQVTASAVTGFWGDTARRTTMWLLEHDAVHVLATDAHGDRHRKPILSEARDYITKQFGLRMAQALLEETPRAIIAGQAPTISASGQSPTTIAPPP